MHSKILVVDDVAFNRTIMRAALKDMEGVEFIDAVNGVQALDIIAEEEISLVILDLMMPIKSGIEVLREMKNEVSFKDIPVIVYSANDDIGSIREALELGAYDYFVKPLNAKQMDIIVPMKVKNALNSYEQQKKIKELNQKMKVELLMANIFQQSLFREKQDIANVAVYGKYIPSQDIGGDFYECIQKDDDIWFIIADVAGYGVAAAMLSSMLKVEFSHCVQGLNSPDKVLKCMNNTFCKITQSNYSLTAFVGVIHDGVLCYSNAGQPYPIVFSAENQKVQILRESNFTLGMIEDEKYSLNKINVGSGDIIMTYTDGLLEDKVVNDSLGVYDDLANCFLNHKHLINENANEFFEFIFRLFGNIDNKAVNNDMAILLLCIK